MHRLSDWDNTTGRLLRPVFGVQAVSFQRTKRCIVRLRNRTISRQLWGCQLTLLLSDQHRRYEGYYR